MSIKLLSLFLIFTFFSLSSQTAFSQNNAWDSVKNVVTQEIALKKQTGEIIFGRLNSVNEKELVIQIATKTDLTTTILTINKAEVKKIWQAALRFDERNTTKGALIGAGVGAAIGIPVTVSATKKEGADGLEALSIPIIMLSAAGIGAIFGFFTKKRHKRGKLIYSV